MKTEREGKKMRFIINNLVYDTEKMEEIATVRKWVKNITASAIFGKEIGKQMPHILWKSNAGRYLLTHEEDFSVTYGQAIEEQEAKELLKQYSYKKYAEMFGEVPEA